MPVFYMESSACLKRYRSEKGTAVVNQIFAGRPDADDLVTSQLLPIEVEAAVARAVKGRTIDERGRGAILRSFVDDLQGMVVIPFSMSVANGASQVARQYALRALDAIHLATALRAAAASPDLVLVASDRELIHAARAAGITVLNPEDEDAAEELAKLRA